jgi:excisionase family DNA binding protein
MTLLQRADADHTERLLSVACAAKRLCVCPRTIRRWIAAGKLRAGRYPSGRVWVSSATVAKIREAQP